MFAALHHRLARRVRRSLDRSQRAAVLVPIIDDGGPVRLLLTRRTEHLPTHRGQVAFPGGLMLPDEEDPIRTALREAEEEVGLLPARVQVVGLLDDCAARSGSVAVTPVVGGIVHLPPLTPRTGEVARIFSIPLEDLARPDLWTERTELEAGREIRFAAFDHDGETLWGLSARITLQLLEVLRAAPAPRRRRGRGGD